MSEWKSVPLSALVANDRAISYGIVQPGSHQDGGVPILRVADIRGGRINACEPMRVSAEIEAAHARTRLRGGELLLTLVGTVGEAAVVPQDLAGWNVARAVAVIPIREDVGAYWVKLALETPSVREMIHGRLNTTVQATLNLKDVAQLPILLPSLDERLNIANILGTLDDKIELNRRTNETLEAMARAIFKSWFVDFDPVRAKASGEPPESICCRFGLAPELLALFPDGFNESEFGEIPIGWDAKPFGEWLVHTIGGDWGADKPDDLCSVEVRIIRGTDMPKLKAGRINDVPLRFVQASKFSNRKLQPEDIVLEVSGGSRDQPTGRGLRITTGMTELLGDAIVPASFCRLLRPAYPEAGPLLSLHLDMIYEAGKTWEYQNQSTGISNFQTKYFLEKERVVDPGASLVAAFYRRVVPLLSGRYVTEINTLTAAREALLPELLSGKLGVPVMEDSQ